MDPSGPGNTQNELKVRKTIKLTTYDMYSTQNIEYQGQPLVHAGTYGSIKNLEADPYPYADWPVPTTRGGWPDPCRSLQVCIGISRSAPP
jgi:hypothetical protein